ncbi:MAG: sigma-54 dependent transcriptional regulator [Verrucomicrobiota bacterium]
MIQVRNSAKILIIDDEKDVHYSFERLFKKEDFQIFSASHPKDGLTLMEKEDPDLVVMDIRMGKENGLETLQEIRAINPRQLVVMMTAYGTSQTAIEAMKLGAYDYVLKPFDIPELKVLINRALNAARGMRESQEVVLELPEEAESGIVGQSSAIQSVYKLVGQVAPTEATVLITGESGTGKELFARAIVQNSKRSKKSFITINCAAIPENLLESELFGHEKGAFTGAVSQRIGKFEQCDGGSLFLDEIGEMPLAIQSKLLRVIQEGEFTRVGGNKPIYTDVRLIAATNRDLLAACKEKIFREDLYYRLNVFSIRLPPLHERLSDIPRMVSLFMEKWRKRNPDAPERVSTEVMDALCSYTWPGNVRELENAIQRAMVLATGDTLMMDDLPPEVVSTVANRVDTADKMTTGSEGESTVSEPPSADLAIEAIFSKAESQKDLALLPWLEKEFIQKALERVNGNQVKASKLLGITRSTLRSRMEKLKLV